MDEQNKSILRDAGFDVDKLEAPEDFEGIGYLVTILWGGAVDDDWIVEGIGRAREQALELIKALSEEAEGTGDDVEVTISEVYVGDTIENTGYMDDERFT